MHRFGGYGHGADSLLMAFMADVDNRVALARTDFDLVMHLCYEWADGVHDKPASLTSLSYYLWC